MATAREWAAAYLAEGGADLSAAERLQGEQPSVTAMLAQMALEKLAKAALLRSGLVTIERARSTHAGATRLVQVVARDRRLSRRLGWRPEAVRALLSDIEELERAQPSLARGGPCLEYPWEDSAGVVRRPGIDLPIVAKFAAHSTRGQRILGLARVLSDRFDEVFP